MKAIAIDPVTKSVYECDFDVTDFRAIGAAVDGYYEGAHEFENGDILVVNEDGMSEMRHAFQNNTLNSKTYGFDFGIGQLLVGRALVIGKSEKPAKSTAEEIRARVLKFYTPLEIKALMAEKQPAL